MVGRQPGILELDDEAEAYALLGDGLLECLPGSWLHCMAPSVRLQLNNPS